MFDLRSKTKWYCPPGKWFYGPTPLPSGISWASDPPTPLEFPIPSVVGVWIFSGTTQSSNALHFEKFGKVQKFDKNTFFYLRSCWKFQQFSRKRYKRAKAPIDLMLHMHLPVTQALRLHKNVSQNNFSNIALGLKSLFAPWLCAVLAVEIEPKVDSGMSQIYNTIILRERAVILLTRPEVSALRI